MLIFHFFTIFGELWLFFKMFFWSWYQIFAYFCSQMLYHLPNPQFWGYWKVIYQKNKSHYNNKSAELFVCLFKHILYVFGRQSVKATVTICLTRFEKETNFQIILSKWMANICAVWCEHEANGCPYAKTEATKPYISLE